MSHVWALHEKEIHYVLNLKRNFCSNLQSESQPQGFLFVRGIERFMGYVTHSTYNFNAVDSIK